MLCLVGIAFVLCAWLSWHVVAFATTASRPGLLRAGRTSLPAWGCLWLLLVLYFTLIMSGCFPQVSCKVFSIWNRKRGFLPLCFFLLKPPDQFQGSIPSRSTSPPHGPRAAPPLAIPARLGNWTSPADMGCEGLPAAEDRWMRMKVWGKASPSSPQTHGGPSRSHSQML